MWKCAVGELQKIYYQHKIYSQIQGSYVLIKSWSEGVDKFINYLCVCLWITTQLLYYFHYYVRYG